MKITPTTILLLSIGVGLAIKYSGPIPMLIIMLIWALACVRYIWNK